MTKQNKKPWEQEWKIIKDIGQGGQGITQLVERKSTTDQCQYVLKKLKKQNDPERRGRMYREYVALCTLTCDGIPRAIESNSEEFRSDVPLYIVTEFIKGKTLSEMLQEQEAFDIFTAINFVNKLLDVLEFCHNEGIVHRDIKPDNIILRNDNINDPVLIDFGISFNKEDSEDTSLTPTGQQLGNRFLHLSELHHKSSLQRDPRSDITQCCGILFFAITKICPISLYDHEEKKPHQRTESKNVLSQIPSDLLSQINAIFDRAFEIPIARRWQSIPALKKALMGVSLSSLNAENDEPGIYLERIKNKLSSSSDYPERQLFKRLSDQIVQEIYNVWRSVVSELGSNFIRSQMGGSLRRIESNIDWDNLTFGVQYGIYNKLYPQQEFFPKFIGYATGNEIILLSEDNGQEIELFRTPLNSEPDFVAFRERLRNFYLKGVANKLGA
ncbi:MAG TPA: serine/threonine-protein kinase [Kamptonema sp.]|nr:serine/threonine-protein kinase [Kamptonema sp.]